jgi:hypothetical protein
MLQAFKAFDRRLGRGHGDLVQQPDQLRGVVGLARGDPAGQVTSPPIADGVNLRGQAAAGFTQALRRT